MDVTDAAVLGVVEGVTEYLPVSSTGHLIVAQRALGIPESDASNAYAISIQSGAILAVVVLYGKRLAQVTKGLMGSDAEGLRIARSLVVAFLPAAVIGLLLDDLIESILFGIWPVVFAWTVGGVLLIALRDRLRRPTGLGLGDLPVRAAVIIGLCQCVAMWPGTSRSLATILGGLLVGLSLPAAVEFSFLLGLLTLTAATAYDAVKHGDTMLATYGWAPILTGLVTAFVSAVLAVKWMVGWLTERGMTIFGWWRLAAAAVVGGLALSGWFDAG